MKFSRFKEKLFRQYKVVILDENTLERKWNNPFKVWQVLLIVIIPLILILSLLVVLFIPKSSMDSFSSSSSMNPINEKQYKDQILTLSKEVAKLQDKTHSNDTYINNLRNLLTENQVQIKLDTTIREAVSFATVKEEDLIPTQADSILRKQVARDELFSFSNEIKTKEDVFDGLLFTPLKGAITSGYDISEGHFAVDIAANEGESVKAAEAGNVIFTDWTAETGYVIIISHNNNFITAYKHNSLIYKKLGDYVEKGEVISAVGNTGELTTGPHLHFEVWLDGKLVDPQTYVDL